MRWQTEPQMAACREDRDRWLVSSWENNWRTHKNYESRDKQTNKPQTATVTRVATAERDARIGSGKKRHKKMKRNNIYDYFYEVLTNFYDFLMGPHTVSGPLSSSWASLLSSERDHKICQWVWLRVRKYLLFILFFCSFFRELNSCVPQFEVLERRVYMHTSYAPVDNKY